MKAAPLPPSLEVVPEEIVLKVEPIVLDPLAPFVPAAVGFRGGRFQADLAVKLGAAVPGGAGPTLVKGVLRATRLAFAGQEGGKALDVALDADLEADAAARATSASAGSTSPSARRRSPARGARRGCGATRRASTGSRSWRATSIPRRSPPTTRRSGSSSRGTVVAGPIGLAVRGSGTPEAQTAELRVDLTPVRLVVPAQLAKAAGAPLVLVARARRVAGRRAA